ncbi:hypothetical protein COY27_04845 [Candidatus Woesearchaeota archaeon CG_4_10_14_0_2_um_filter_33_13]|nr:MAG: hypothetical protein COY27_04845 [Candidatus Woesearchaeota archaeon CG_4_10_14_0_2_um_filter_33_13]
MNHGHYHHSGRLPELIPPKVKRKIGRGIIITVILILLTSMILLFFGLKMNFLVGEELKININQPQYLYQTQSNQLVEISFEIGTNNFFRCESHCEYKLVNLFTSEIVATDNFNLAHGASYQKMVFLNNKFFGNKLYLYTLNVNCNNRKSLICLTEEIKKHDSVLFLVETNLTASEISLSEEIKNQLTNNLQKYSTAIEKISYQKDMFSAFFIYSIEAEEISAKLDQIEGSLVSFENTLKRQISSWENSDFTSYSKIDQVDDILVSLGQTRYYLDELFILRNSTTQVLQNISLIQEQILMAYNNSPLIVQNLERLQQLQHQMTVGGNFSERSVNEEMQEINMVLSKLVQDYQNDLKMLHDQYSFLINMNFTNYNCLSLQEIQEQIKILNISSNSKNLDLFISKNCLINNSEIIFPNLTIPDLSYEITENNLADALKLNEQHKQCCAFNQCKNYGVSQDYPTLFIHGHAFNEGTTPEASLAAFAKIQEEMVSYGYINLGDVSFDQYYDGLEQCSFPTTMRATYYYIPSFGVGKYKVTVQKSERIENYALRLREMIELIKKKTGQQKINLVAHSMGGLVAREYLDLFGTGSVDKVIFVNTPHHGVSGKVEKYCSIIGASKECEDLSAGSIFLNRINSKPNPFGVELYNIRSKGCLMDNQQDGDGIVTFESAYLSGAEDFVISGKCIDSLQSSLHSDVLDPEMYPQVRELILEIINKNKTGDQK